MPSTTRVKKPQFMWTILSILRGALRRSMSTASSTRVEGSWRRDARPANDGPEPGLVAPLPHGARIRLEPAQPPPEEEQLLVQHGLEARQPLLDRVGLQQRLLLDEVDLDDAGEQVRQRARVVRDADPPDDA